MQVLSTLKEIIDTVIGQLIPGLLKKKLVPVKIPVKK